MRIAIYSPIDVQRKDSDQYLEDYILSFNHTPITRFKTFEECISASGELFDILYIHYDKINKKEFQRIEHYHRSRTNIVLVVKLNKHNEVQDLNLDFAQIIYEPISFSKVEKSLATLVTKKIKREKIQNGDKPFSNIHALIVEDNPINQKMIQHTLKNMGISSECSNNGQEGFDAYTLNNERYDVIFMDIQMPVMNGVDATKKILAYEKNRDLVHTPIIAVTANALKGDRERFLGEGMDEYVSKPIDLKKFMTVLRAFFPMNSNEELNVPIKKDILLYKQTTTEAKIISAILNKLDYSVDIAENIEELKRIINIKSYKCILLDRTNNDLVHNNLTEQIKSKNIPSLLFIDSKSQIVPSDEEDYTFVSNNITDYMSIKEKVDYMISLDKVS